jgi:3-dehydroquinate synthase
MTVDAVTVGLGDRSYQVLVGPDLLSDAAARIAPFAPARRLFVISDHNVLRAHGAKFLGGLRQSGFAVHELALDPGEASKSFAGLERVCGALLDGRIERGDLVVAFGGGVIGDLAGFAAGVVKRGVDFVQIPTTLLAQVDSSVGGKTAINAAQGKNLIGLFHQPRLVLADTNVLSTLPRRELLAGFAEVVKYGLLGDAAFFDWLDAHAEAVLAGPGPERTYSIVKSVAAKAAIVAQDEREGGIRALLNLGHTFGHALEAETGFGERLLHGEGVAIGMALAFQFSERLGTCPRGTAERIAAFFRRVGLPASPRDIPGFTPSAETMLDHMEHDKKAQGGQLTLILARGIGHAFVQRNADRAAILDLWRAAL